MSAGGQRQEGRRMGGASARPGRAGTIGLMLQSDETWVCLEVVWWWEPHQVVGNSEPHQGVGYTKAIIFYGCSWTSEEVQLTHFLMPLGLKGSRTNCANMQKSNARTPLCILRVSI